MMACFASDDMYRLYKAGVILRYERLIIIMKQLEDSKHHKKIMRDLNLFLNKGHTHEKALKLALRNTMIYFMKSLIKAMMNPVMRKIVMRMKEQVKKMIMNSNDSNVIRMIDKA